MSAETLRKAAALMRERAKAATDSPWSHDDEAPGVVMSPDTPNFTWDGVFVCATQIDEHGEPDLKDAEHIASWHPVVALAVADWLDVWADSGWVECECNLDDGDPHCEHSAALAVARAYLGKTP